MRKVIQLLVLCCLEEDMSLSDIKDIFKALSTAKSVDDCIRHMLAQDLIQVSLSSASGYELSPKGTKLLGSAIKQFIS